MKNFGLLALVASLFLISGSAFADSEFTLKCGSEHMDYCSTRNDQTCTPGYSACRDDETVHVVYASSCTPMEHVGYMCANEYYCCVSEYR